MTALSPATDPAHDDAQEREPLDAIFHPRSIAVVGATEKEGSVGRTILWNLLSSPFGGTVYPVNPTRPAILGVKAYPSISAIGEPVDLAVIVTPAKTAPGLVAECGEAGIKGVIIISAGFKEIGPEGVELERQVLEAARRYGIRVIGPNCLGIMNPIGRMNATFAADICKPGRVGFISQSGALLTAILDWAAHENVGFSSIVSLGSMLDVGWGDIIDYLGNDPNTDSIVIYMETIGDARAFLSAAREVALQKPIIVIKPGRTVQAAKAAASHTGSLDRLGRRPGRGLPARRRAARGLDQRAVRGLRDPGQAAAPQGPAAVHRDQRGRPGRHRHGRAHRRRRRAVRHQRRDDGGAQRGPAVGLEPQQPDRHHRRRAAGAVREGPRDRRGGPGDGRPARHPDARRR